MLMAALGVMLGGCSSAPLSESEPELGSVAERLQQEVEMNADAAEKLRLISRLYLADYAVLEWYQPIAGVIGFSVVQPGGYEPIDQEGLRGLKPAQVFKRFAPSLEVPEALVKLEAHPDVLQELQAREAIERFSPAADLLESGVVPQAAFGVSQGPRAFHCPNFASFKSTYCNGWDSGTCWANLTTIEHQRASGVQESQGTICSLVGVNALQINIDGCQTAAGFPEGLNRCSGKTVSGTGAWFNTGEHIARSWHGKAQTYWWGDDAYNHLTSGDPITAGGTYHLGTRQFFD
jgi:hypothetical protein